MVGEKIGGISFHTSANKDVSTQNPSLTTSPADAREINFPYNMTAWGFMDVTKGGAQTFTENVPNVGCPDALPNKSDLNSVNVTTQAIQCRLNALGVGPNPGNLYFPPGIYYINQTLRLTVGHWVTNPDSSQAFVSWGGGDRSQWTGLMHIMGRDPSTTKIVWAGSCETDPDIADPSTVQKYNDIFYVAGMRFNLERLTLDGQNCAGDGIDMVSVQSNISPVHISEMIIENLREVGIIGDRDTLTTEEIREGNPTGMVSEVSITNVSLQHIGYAGILVGAANALDYWVRDSLFSDCGIGITDDTQGVPALPGLPGSKGLPWGMVGSGNFDVSNSVFQNNRAADVYECNTARVALRNNYSVGGTGPFAQSCMFLAGELYLQGNTIIASKGVVPIVATEEFNSLQLIQNKIITQNNTPAMIVWTAQNSQTASFAGASPAVANLLNNSESNVVSIANQYTTTTPFSTASGHGLFNDLSYQAGTAPGIHSNSSQTPLQCAVSGSLASLVDGRTYCSYTANWFQPVYNLLTFDDQVGVTIVPGQPSLVPPRPEVLRYSNMPVLTQTNTAEAGYANSQAIQAAVDDIVAKQASCAPNDYSCSFRMGVVFLPAGLFHISKTIHIPVHAQIKIVGTWETMLAWYWYGINDVGQPVGASPIFKVFAPSHVTFQDMTLWGSGDPNFPSPLGEGILVEVADKSTSRVLTDQLSIGSYSVAGIGNVPFEMRSFQNAGTSSIIGNGSPGTGYFAYFGGGPSDVVVGGNANLMIQDTWYEGSASRYVTCQANDSANITIETSMLSLGGWHGVTSSNQTSVNIDSCSTQTAIIASDLGRAGETGYAPTPSLILPGTSTAKTEVLLLANNEWNNSESTIISGDHPAEIDQATFVVDPAAQAKYANVLGTFGLQFSDTSFPNGVPNQFYFAAKQTGTIQTPFLRSLLSQAMDPRMSGASKWITPITDQESSDIQMYRMFIGGTRQDLQFVLPGNPGS